MSEKIEIGNLVRLAAFSGRGPEMVIIRKGKGKVTCLWFNKQNDVQEHEFDESLLAISSESGGPTSVPPDEMDNATHRNC